MKSISFIGGDLRNAILAEMLNDEFCVFQYGLEQYFDNSILQSNVQSCANQSNYIVTPIPFSIDGKNLNAPLSKKEISLEEFFCAVHNKFIICGSINKKYADILEFNNNQIIDIMKYEELVRKNAIPTAEGVIKIIIEKTDITIDGANIAVLGHGRVGKKISELLYKLNSNVFCYDMKKEEVANIKLCGYNVLEDIGRSFNNIDIIVNTIPELIIDESNFKYIDKKALIIDVASKPGGVDYEYANENGYTCVHALGIPGKVAPRSAAKYIKDLLIDIIK